MRPVMLARASGPARLIAAALLFALLLPALAVAQVAVPTLTARVTDLTDTLTQAQRQALEQRLAAFEQQKGVQLAVLLVPTTAPEAIEQYAIRVVDRWKLGREAVDDGLLLLVAKQDRKVRVEVGYGLEGVVPDAIANRVIEEIIVPRFRQGDFYGGITAGIDRLLRVIEGEPLPPPPEQARPQSSESQSPLVFVIIAFVVLSGLLRGLLGRLPGSIVTAGIVGFLFWLLVGPALVALVVGAVALVFGVTGIGGGRGGFYGGLGGGIGRGGLSGGFGGGGGFSGGGGGFGGGGASGSW